MICMNHLLKEEKWYIDLVRESMMVFVVFVDFMSTVLKKYLVLISRRHGLLLRCQDCDAFSVGSTWKRTSFYWLLFPLVFLVCTCMGRRYHIFYGQYGNHLPNLSTISLIITMRMYLWRTSASFMGGGSERAHGVFLMLYCSAVSWTSWLSVGTNCTRTSHSSFSLNPILRSLACWNHWSLLATANSSNLLSQGWLMETSAEDLGKEKTHLSKRPISELRLISFSE